MFDLSFGKLLLVLVIGLVVLGPQRLPVAIKYVTGWIKALRRISASVQLELSNELKLQELQDSLKKIEQDGIKNISPEVQASIDRIKESISDLTNTLHQSQETSDLSRHSSSYPSESSDPAVIDTPSDHETIEGNENNVKR